jgi:hypothetical protein
MAASTRAELMGNRYGHLPYRKRVITVSTASTATYQLSPRESGAMLMFGTVSTINVQLPKISSKFLGLNYEIYFSTADAQTDYDLTCLDSSAGVYLPGLTSAGVGSPTTVAPATTDGPHAIRVTAISSIIWLGEPITNVYTTAAKTHAAGGWTTA